MHQKASIYEVVGLLARIHTFKRIVLLLIIVAREQLYHHHHPYFCRLDLVGCFRRLQGTRILSEASCRDLMRNQLPNGETIFERSFDPHGFSESLGPGIGMGLGVSTIVDPSTASGGARSGRGESGWGGVAST